VAADLKNRSNRCTSAHFCGERRCSQWVITAQFAAGAFHCHLRQHQHVGR